MTKHRIYTTSFASVYPHYLAKAEKKGRTKAEVDEIVRWLTGYSQKKLEAQIEKRTDFETFFHHQLVHEAGYGVARTKTGEFRFTRPDGTPLDDYYLVDECFSGNILGERNEQRGIRIGPDTIASRYGGETMDYNIAIGVLLAARKRERRAEAGTPCGSA